MSPTTSPLSGLDVALYLRKSRVEDKLPTDEVLSKHRQALLEHAQQNGLHIIETYPEVVSGESLYARPQMLRLLEDVEEGKYDAVLCMDLDRLSRGRMKDQGIILDTFRDSNTRIITPDKVYDLTDELDDEIAEMKTFISRREYKIINKRLQRGLKQTIRSGAYVANAPYGYHKTTVDRKPTLEIYEPEAKFVQMMFQLYNQGFGCTSVARHVNALGARPHRAPEFSRTSIFKILSNPTYIGKIVWDQKKHIRKGVKGNVKHITIYQPKESWTITDGLHPAIVDRATFDRTQEIMVGRYRPPQNDGTVKSPLVGLIQCANCGQNMQRMMMKGNPYLLCNRPGCCAGAKFLLVEHRVLTQLQATLAQLLVDQPLQRDMGSDTMQLSLEAIHKEQGAAQRQKDRLYELLELGEYDIPTFRARMEAVREKVAALDSKEVETRRALDNMQIADPAALAAKIQTVLAGYETADPAGRNALLRTVITGAVYRKEKKTKPSDFELQLLLKPF